MKKADIRKSTRAPLVVVGAGPAGCAAAITAARMGLEVWLVERYGFAGGMATVGLVHPWMSYFAGDKQIIGGIFNEVVEALKARGAYKDSSHFNQQHHCFDPEILKQVLQKLLLEAGVKLHLHTFVVDAIASQDKIKSLVIAGKSGLEEMLPEMVIDASGDGDVAAWSGAAYEKGRAKDGLMQPATLHFRMANVDISRMLSREEMNEIYDQAKAAGEITCPRENLLWFDTTIPDQIHFNTTRVNHVDGTSREDMARAEIENRQQVEEIAAFLQHRMPGFEKAYLLSTASQVGFRETRRIMGEYVLTADDVLAARKFDDRIALSSYPIDVHNPAGTGTELKYLPPGEFYSIPYRCLVPKEINSLLVAGRPISTTHEAHASSRVQVICYATGQAAGVAAALALENKIQPRNISPSYIQQVLRSQGAILE